MVKKLLVHSMRKSYKKEIKKNLEYKRLLKQKKISCMLNGKDMTIYLIVGLIKMTLYKMSQYLPPYKSFGGNI